MTLTKDLNNSKKEVSNLEKNVAQLTESNTNSEKQIDELNVKLSLAKDDRKKEVEEAHSKRYTWAAIAAVIALALGAVLNR